MGNSFDSQIEPTGRPHGRFGGKSTSIQDVAAAAKVSIATVSRVLNNPSLVSAATIERVNESIKRLGYVPNPFAQGLITKASRVLGIALPDIHGEFYSELLRGADEEARRLKYHLLVSSEAPAAHNGSPGRSLAFSLIDGLALMITEPNATLWREACELELPVVVLDVELHEHGVDSILVDNAVGTREAVEHLLQGTPADRLYFVGGPKENFDTLKRAEAFEATLRSAGATMRPEQVAYGTYSAKWGAEWTRSVQNNLRGAGVLAGNDEIALGVLQTAAELGLKVPEELRIVGFDDTRLASIVRPTLSAVRVPLAEVGAAAIRSLAERIEEPERARRTTTLATKLVVRDSSAVKT